LLCYDDEAAVSEGNPVLATTDRGDAMHPVHAFLLAGTVPPFIGAALSDYAYYSTYHVQWSNFASWLIVGGLVFGLAALACSLVASRRADRRGIRYAISLVLILAICVLGVVNAFIHARDAWATMPTGIVLSLIVAVLACVATALGFSSLRPRSRP
jgi:uncharacterized membrane protein